MTERPDFRRNSGNRGVFLGESEGYNVIANQ